MENLEHTLSELIVARLDRQEQRTEKLLIAMNKIANELDNTRKVLDCFSPNLEKIREHELELQFARWIGGVILIGVLSFSWTGINTLFQLGQKYQEALTNVDSLKSRLHAIEQRLDRLEQKRSP